MKKFLWLNRSVLLLSALIVLAALFTEQIGPVLQYQRQAILQGQLHRLLTAHLVHTNTYHTLMNLLGLILIWSIACRYISQREWWLSLFLSGLIVSIGLILFNPDIQWYRGLSGILHGLLLIAVLKAKQLSGLVKTIILFVLVLKVLLEQSQIGLWQSAELIDAAVIVDAHLYGLFGGLVSYLILRRFKSDKMFGD